MKQIRKRLTYANVMSSIAVFMVLGGAAVAATQLPKNSVGKKQLKANAVTTAKIKKNAVTAAKVKKNAVTTAKIKDGAVTGPKINLSTLGTVPSAASAGTAGSAGSLAGQTPFLIRLGLGQSQTIASHGVVSLVATCEDDGGDDRIRVLMQTSQNGAVANGEDDFNGSGVDTLNTDTPADDRVFLEETATAGQTNVSYEYDQGWVLGPDLKMLTTNSEGIALGLNYGGSTCLVAGVVNAIG